MTAKPVKIDTPLGPEALLFRRMVGREELGRLFEYQIDLLSDDRQIDLNSVIGQRMTVHLDLGNGSERYFNGVVARFAHVGEVGRRALYRATLRPWLWLLSHKANCRIFQTQTVPEIVAAIFREHGLTDFSDSLTSTYPTWEYKVQYRESDFNFVSRLLEHAGIYYYFKHEAGKHTLVLADGYSAHAPASGYASVPYFPKDPKGTVLRKRDHLDQWIVAGELQPGAFVADDFDFTRPKAELQSKIVSQHTLAKAAQEIYDYPGTFLLTADGEAYVKARLEELYAEQEVVEAEGDVRGLFPGALFSLTDFPRESQNAEHLIIGATYEFTSLAYESGTESDKESVFRCTLRAINSKTPFRPQRRTPVPFVHGPQTAIVVGKSGEEIWTDQYGRVKLQFHWDRESKSDEVSSCWVRVAQLWAGTKWGGIHVPRIGQEVVVDFLEGDPDRPLVTGRVYNGTNMPPYALPANQTQSGIKSRSSKGGAEANFNEIRFEDKKGSEQIFMQAEKNFDTLIKNDETRTVNHDRKKDIKNDETTTVGGNRTETVTKDETITINGNRTEKVAKEEKITIDGGRTETVAKDETITINGNRTEKVAKEEKITIDGGRTETVAKDETITINGNRTEKVAKEEKITIDGGRTETVAKDETVTINGAQTVKVAKDVAITISGKRTLKITGDDAITISGKRAVSVTGEDKLDCQKLTVSGLQEITLKCGAASLSLKASGQVELKGVMVTVEGSAKLDVTSSGITTIAGALVKAG